ncbi:hypothetical protein LSH36_57g08132 [Paralvinella palmiformis]|uniref:Uncharacterized protein n=1 Tax=Paralvinella palmiformis TaxID=53620 RepID=A0AAD9K590_9ANNE|nr:hypothetical protein LSH36_57g08132 [Paralvinella palmiformis]
MLDGQAVWRLLSADGSHSPCVCGFLFSSVRQLTTTGHGNRKYR